VTADRVVEPGQADARGEVRGAVPVLSEVVPSASGASVSVGSGESEAATEGLGVGLPWTPPVAALAIVPATMSTAHAMSSTLSGFSGSGWRDDPANAIGQTTVSESRAGGRRKSQDSSLRLWPRWWSMGCSPRRTASVIIRQRGDRLMR
jgi:hypothetical protein